jgi:hypothetical protein
MGTDRRRGIVSREVEEEGGEQMATKQEDAGGLADIAEIHRQRVDKSPPEPVQPGDDWGEDFWKAFEGMPEDFERPPQIRRRTKVAKISLEFP